jgi:hypothetical protein
MDEQAEHEARALRPNATKYAKMVEIAKKEEAQWNEFREKNRITSVHEVHRLGGFKPVDDVNKARADYFKQMMPTKLERLVCSVQ